MRWKLLVFTSIAAALVASALWLAVIIIFFGPAGLVEQRNLLWPLSLTIPLAVACAAGFFVYRHTSRRRRFQALITAFVVMVVAALTYFVAAQRLPKYLDLAPKRSQPAVIQSR
jgi:hypothetical protein